MKKSVIAVAVSGVLASCWVAPAMAQNASLEQISRELKELKEKNERLEGEVEYLKENAKGMRKEGAQEALDIANLKTTTSKFAFSGDFRYRHEEFSVEGTVNDRARDRFRLRFGAQVKVNDNINAKIQFSTVNTGGDNARSTNQTLGNGLAGNGAWDRKALGIDLAYVDWKPNNTFNVILGKQPMPWTRTASYFWDGDLTPEGGAVKFTRGKWFANASYLRMAEQDTGSNVTYGIARGTDSNVVIGQFGVKQPIGRSSLTLAASYFQISHVQDQPVTVNTATCAIYSTPNPTFGGSSYGNSTYNMGGVNSGCSVLLSGFSEVQLLAQYDFLIGTFPISVFADYMQNNDAVTNPTTNSKLDTAIAAGITLNKASAAKSWEVGVIYQKSDKDAVFGQFHDSDFGGGFTDTKGLVVKAAFVPMANWTLNATYFMNDRFNNIAGSASGTLLAGVFGHDYKRLQLDLNYKF